MCGEGGSSGWTKEARFATTRQPLSEILKGEEVRERERERQREKERE